MGHPEFGYSLRKAFPPFENREGRGILKSGFRVDP
jgi:hypothetical protein